MIRRCAVVTAVALLGAVVPVPAALAQSQGPSLAVAPTCIPPGVATRLVILGAGWSNEPVTLARISGNAVTELGRPTPRTSPVREQGGSFTFTTTVTAGAPFQVTATQGRLGRAVAVAVQSGCPVQIALRPACLTGPGQVQVSGTGFNPGGEVPIDVDPFGDAEALPQVTKADEAGRFSTSVDVPFRGATVPIVATRPSVAVTTAPLPPARAVAFVEPCPPPPTATTATRPPPPGSTVTTGSTTTAGPTVTTGPTTTGSVPLPADPPPLVPPARVPGPGVSAEVTISPVTVRPGRCAVLVYSAAPPSLPVSARFADGPLVNGQTGSDGRAVISVCHPHHSGIPVGPVRVLVGIGPAPPVPVFTVLRVPSRPQPPMLQPGSGTRRS